MKKILKIQVLCCILTGFVCLGAWSQSPTSKATMSLFNTDADNYNSVLDFSSVEFEKGFAYVGFASTQQLDLGYATTFGDIYIAGSFYGDVYGSSTNTDTITQTTNYTITDNQIENTVTTDETSFSSAINTEENIASVLVGLGTMGFKLNCYWYDSSTSGSYGSTYTSQTTSTITDADSGLTTTTTYSPDGYAKDRTIMPFIEWGMAMPLGSISLKPIVSIMTKLHSEASYAKVDTSESTASYTTASLYQENESYIAVIPNVGVEAEFENGSEAFVNYTITPYLYTASYSDLEGNETKVSGVVNSYSNTETTVVTDASTTTTTISAADITEKSTLEQNFNLGYTANVDVNEKLSFKGGAVGYFLLDSSSSVDKTTDITVTDIDDNSVSLGTDTTTTTTITTEGVTTEDSSFTASPYLRAAVSYVAIQDKLTLNLGYIASMPSVTTTTTKTLQPSAGTTTETTVVDASGNTIDSSSTTAVDTTYTESSEKETTIGTFSSSVNAGFSLNFADSACLDTILELPIDSMSIDNLKAATFSMAVSVKF